MKHCRKQTPLHISVKTNSYSCVIALVKKGNANLNVEDDNKRTPLHKAVELISDSRKDLVKFLIEYVCHVSDWIPLINTLFQKRC